MSVILVADDQKGIRDVLEMILTGMGHRVLTCADGEEAMAAVDRESIDLLITDVLMPGMDGIEVLRELREVRPSLPVIVMSDGGQLNKGLLLRISGLLGATVTLEKPFAPASVARAVEQALGGQTGDPARRER